MLRGVQVTILVLIIIVEAVSFFFLVFRSSPANKKRDARLAALITLVCVGVIAVILWPFFFK